MKTIKVIIHVADWQATDLEKATMKAEVVARFGAASETFQAYDARHDEEITLAVKYLDWWEGIEVNKAFISKTTFQKVLERLNFYIIE